MIKKTHIWRGLLCAIVCVTLCATFCSLFCACASKPGFQGNGDLCGLVIDENNQPVKDFTVYCKSKEKKTQTIKPVLTNESGLFVFYDLPAGSYCITGEKTNYLRLNESVYDFYDRSKIFCIQTKTFHGTVKAVVELLHLGEKQDAALLLDSLCVPDNSPEEMIVDSYKFFTIESYEERKKLALALNRKSEQGPEFIKEYSQKLLEVLK